MSTHRTSLLAALFAATVLTFSFPPANALEEDPAARAAVFEQQARDLRAKADEHEQIARMHRSGAGTAKLRHESIAQHCERIAENLRSAARESEELAAAYRDVAGQR